MFHIDPLYLILAAPGLVIALIATFITKTTFAKYSEVPSTKGLTGAEAAAKLLKDAGIFDVAIEETQGFLSDHYDPMTRTLRLSPGVFESRSLSAIGVACHEAGHAIQHARSYYPLYLRSALVPITNFSSIGSYIIIPLGFLMQSFNMIIIGIALFSLVVLFSLITLPVEWNASARAKELMVSAGIVSQDEAYSAGKVLNAAFLTYVASAISALLTLLYYLIRAGVFNSRNDD